MKKLTITPTDQITQQYLSASNGEFAIAKTLQYLGITFQTEYLIVIKSKSGKKRRCRSDFYFEYKGEKFIIEFNGYQHFGLCNLNKFNTNQLEDIKERDKLKRKWAYYNYINFINFNVLIDDPEYSQNFIENRITPTSVFTAIQSSIRSKYAINVQ